MFQERANLHNALINNEIKATFEQKILTNIDNPTSVIYYAAMSGSVVEQMQMAMQEFDTRKMGDGQFSNSFREQLERDLDNLQTHFRSMMESNRLVRKIFHAL